ncbi:hypothetical protein SPDO_27460 [Sphingomonas dokdonensis]|uniref:Uncharacterized protein n=1 Tax=Sphingomonas dokdonensis TaxID=344880 RepID=A0A245ZGQ6_9SPHN|nr:hypothetical protein SPDO_27460 [Sphingomonas dokdonensis]
MHQAAGAGGEVVDHVGLAEFELVEIDDVDVGEVTGGEQAAVREPDGERGVAGLLLHRVGEIEQGATGAVAAPVGEHEGRQADVADRADMCAAIRQAG